jgi:hypothetical protein
MSVYLLWEWTNPKEVERNQRRLKHEKDWLYPYIRTRTKEGVFKPLGLSDGTGRIIALFTFENMDAFDKVWNDMEFKKGTVQMSYLVDNFTSRVLRDVIDIEP